MQMDPSTNFGDNSCVFDKAVLENVAGPPGHNEGSEGTEDACEDIYKECH